MIRAYPPFVLHNLVWPLVTLLLTVFARFKVRGRENLKNLRGPVIFAGNHGSEIDVVLVTDALPFLSRFSPIFYVAKKREFYKKKGLVAMLYGGAFFKLWGAYPVREGLKNYALALNIHEEMLKEGRSLLIFPEGRISSDDAMLSAHGGVAYLAHATGAPIVPVAIKAVRNFTWIGLFFGGYRFSVTFGTPIRPDTLFEGKHGLDVADYKQAAELIMQRVKTLL